MAGKLAENNSVTLLCPPEQLGAATFRYNGQALTTGAIMVDTNEVDQAVFLFNVGTIQDAAAAATLVNSIYQSQTNDPTTASLISGASVNKRSADSVGIAKAYVDCKNSERYLMSVVELQNANDSTQAATVDVNVVAIMDSKKRAVDGTIEFDV